MPTPGSRIGAYEVLARLGEGGMVTQAGVILGTAGYIAPKQARGRAVDKRADIWAFGCVLFETLTGERPFKGEDLTERLAAIVKDSPDLVQVPAAGGRYRPAAGQPHTWSPTPLRSSSANAPAFDLSPDGKRVISTMPASAASRNDQLPGVTFLFSFADELRRKVPSK
jgi:serine/threonine protein kinase